MLVYGDAARREPTASAVARLGEMVARAAAEPAGLGRHAALVAALIEAGMLAQGVADALFAARRQVDERSPAADAAMAVALALARAVTHSWREGFAARPVAAPLAELTRLALPDEVELKTPEGFAFYALYPEGHAAAVAAFGPDLVSVGIRSIGTTLAVMAAAGAGSERLPATLRPVGHPFERRLSLGPALRGELGAAATGPVAIADEGPGLSGSSLAGAAIGLEEAGVASDRITLLPSHPGAPGLQASEAIRAVWTRLPRRVVPFEELVLAASRPHQRLASWIENAVGPLVAPLEDVAGGAWRSHLCGPEAGWPPAHPWAERRKYLARTQAGAFLAKFAGLGRIGEAKLARARTLAAAGFTPEPVTFLHGFLLERWHAEARPLRLGEGRPPDLVDRIGRYLAFRARAFPADHGAGASVDALYEMARVNAGEALGSAAAETLDRWRPELAGLAQARRPVETDGRLHAWEWIATGLGLLKADALDHHVGHDLVGCQDLAWDLVGATVELELDADDTERLLRTVAAADIAVDPGLLAFYEPCYLAFQLGAWTMATTAAAPDEAARISRAAARYRDRLQT
ncbi:MAG: hypothetical protein JO048_11770, partial [Methylobacteriaceae bacterium]|nr:hypothetical protein [Methylobacteriaceae bacterium]